MLPSSFPFSPPCTKFQAQKTRKGRKRESLKRKTSLTSTYYKPLPFHKGNLTLITKSSV